MRYKASEKSEIIDLVERPSLPVLRTRVARLFPNEASCLRLVSPVLMEISEDW